MNAVNPSRQIPHTVDRGSLHGARRHRPVRRGAFSLIELLSATAIIAVLLAILIPVGARIVASSRQNHCAANLRQIMVSTLLYSTENSNQLPFVVDADSNRWTNQLRPYLANLEVTRTDPGAAFLCRSDDIDRPSTDSDVCSYGLNIRVHVAGNANNVTQHKYLPDIPLPSKTILYGDAWRSDNTVAHALSLQVAMGDHHGDGSNYAFADGHVEFLPLTTVQERTSPAGQPDRIAIP